MSLRFRIELYNAYRFKLTLLATKLQKGNNLGKVRCVYGTTNQTATLLIWSTMCIFLKLC